MDISIIYEDEYLLVINKPANIVVNRAQSVKGTTVQDWVDAYLHLPLQKEKPDGGITKQLQVKDIHEVFRDRSGLAHRIDKETSGCLLIAKNAQVLGALLDTFREREMKKTYLAIVHGVLVPSEGEICAPVGRLPWNSERFGVVAGGKESVTKYKVEKTFMRDRDTYSYISCYPKTGRTHQIRVHLKYINHPIVGDYLYAGRKTARSDRVWAPRVMLHAWKLSFIHPVTQKEFAVEAPVPDDMMKIVT